MGQQNLTRRDTMEGPGPPQKAPRAASGHGERFFAIK